MALKGIAWMPRSGPAGALLVFLLLAGALWAQSARAEYRACNETSYVLEVAVATLSELGPISQGWFIVDPGTCRIVLHSDLHEEMELFAYARSTDIYGEEWIYFAGDTPFCVATEDFYIEDVGLCTLRSFNHARFSSIAFQGGEWTTYFSEDKGFDLEMATIAGLQRLLDRLGFSVGVVDGIFGTRTRLALDTFRDEHGAGEDTNALFSIMNEALAARLSEIGLKVCNRSDHRIWTAVGVGKGNGADVETRGWRYADAGNCVTVLQELLDEGEYFLYAEAVDENGFAIKDNEKAMVWEGDHALCVSTIRFVISEQGQCDARNFDQRGFYRLNIQGGKHFVETLE